MLMFQFLLPAMAWATEPGWPQVLDGSNATRPSLRYQGADTDWQARWAHDPVLPEAWVGAFVACARQAEERSGASPPDAQVIDGLHPEHPVSVDSDGATLGASRRVHPCMADEHRRLVTLHTMHQAFITMSQDQAVPTDPIADAWGHAIRYQPSGLGTSLGSDGKEGGTGYAADIQYRGPASVVIVGPPEPPFRSVTAVQIYSEGSGVQPVEQTALAPWIACLDTVEHPSADLPDDLGSPPDPRITFIVADARGDRSFDAIDRTYIKGLRGTYRAPCLLELLSDAMNDTPATQSPRP